MVLLSNAVPRLLLEGPGSDFISEVEPNYSKGQVIAEAGESPSMIEKKSDVDLLVTKWIRRPDRQSQKFPSSPNMPPPNWNWSNYGSAQQFPTRESPRGYSQSEAKRNFQVYSPHTQAKGTAPGSPAANAKRPKSNISIFPSEQTKRATAVFPSDVKGPSQRTTPVFVPDGRADRREAASDRTRTTPVFRHHEKRGMSSDGSWKMDETVERKWEEVDDEEDDEEDDGRVRCASQ